MDEIIEKLMKHYQPKTVKLGGDISKSDSYVVAQDAYISASPADQKQNLATTNLMTCIGFSIRSPSTNQTTLAHIQIDNNLRNYFDVVIKPLYSGYDVPMEIALGGGEFGTSDHIVQQIYELMFEVGDFVVTHLDLGWEPTTPKYMSIDMLKGYVSSKVSTHFLGPDYDLSYSIKSIKKPKKFWIF